MISLHVSIFYRLSFYRFIVTTWLNDLVKNDSFIMVSPCLVDINFACDLK